ncbi:MAG: DNA cytosine methyltransferase [Clostridia bacterium]
MLNIVNKSLKDYKFIDLFCGIGGFHLALASFGAKCVFASDINQRTQKVYENNFNILPFGDLRNIKNIDIPKHDILCAGFPCQPFSISGNQEGLDHESGKLFYEIIRIAKFHQPKVIFLENVKNLRNHDQGNTLNTILSELNKVNYDVFFEVLNASDFGVPQARKRIYIVCFRKDLKVTNFNFPAILENTVSLDSVLLPINDNALVIEQKYELLDGLNIKSLDRRKLIRIGKTGLGRQGERIYSPLGQAVTLSSQGGGPAGKTGMYLIDGNIRKLHKRECARVMGFPDSFILPDSTAECYKQFGNSVVVDVLQKILNNIALILEGEKI